MRSVVKIWRSQWDIMYNVNFQDLCIKTSWIHTSHEIEKACSFSPSHINQSYRSITNIAGGCSKTDSFTSPYFANFLVANSLYFKCSYPPASDTKLSSPMSRRSCRNERGIKQTGQYFTVIVCPGFLTIICQCWTLLVLKKHFSIQKKRNYSKALWKTGIICTIFSLSIC